jgi:trigger factor
MQVSLENTGKLERKLTVRIPAGAYESQVKSRLAEVGRTVRLKGFRPGKVPVKVVEQRFGAQIRGEAMNELVRSSFQQAVDQQKLRPAVTPTISTSGEPVNGEIEYTATFEILPEIGPLDVSSLAVTRHEATVADIDVDAMIETLRQQRRAWAQSEHGAKEGDMVLFELAAQGDGFSYPAEGRERMGTILGSGAVTKDLEDKLVGRAAGDEFETDLAFPADFRIVALADKQAHVVAKVVRVQEPKLPDVDDAFIASFGINDGGLEKFRADVRANLERELKNVLAARLKNEVVQKLVDRHQDMDVPESMVAAEANALAQQAQAQAQQQQGQQVAANAETYRPLARRRVVAGVLVGEIARQNGVRVDSRRVAETLASIASTYEEPERVVELYQRDPQLMNSLQNRVLEDQVAEWVAEHAQVNVQALGFNEAMRPAS